jgi:hypothetical protein
MRHISPDAGLDGGCNGINCVLIGRKMTEILSFEVGRFFCKILDAKVEAKCASWVRRRDAANTTGYPGKRASFGNILRLV